VNQMNKDNIMRKIYIEKIVLNIGCGKTGDIKKATKVLYDITKQKPVITKSKSKSTFGVPKNKEIGVKVTVRKNVEQLLKTLIKAVDNKLLFKNFDNFGNFSFGISEHISVPGVEYDPNIGIFGFDVCVRLARPGFSGSKIGKAHRITKKEAMEFIKQKFGIELVEKRVSEY